MATVLDLTFIADEQRRVAVADDMALVYDGQANNGMHWRWDHLCTSVDLGDGGRARKRIAPYLSNPGHSIVTEDPLTIAPSLLCPDCKRHGFVRSGHWVEA